MIGNLDEALRTLLVESLPALFGGGSPPVALSLVADEFSLDPRTADVEAGEPRVDNQVDELAFDPNAPAGPYQLSKSFNLGPRRMYLTSVLGDRVALGKDEVLEIANDPQSFRLAPKPSRILTQFSGVRVLYGVTAVFVQVRISQAFGVRLTCSDMATLERAEALTLAVLELERRRLVDEAQATFADGRYAARVAIEALKLGKGAAPSATSRQLNFIAEVALKASRALSNDEGLPIRRIVSPNRAGSPAAVDIDPGVEA